LTQRQASQETFSWGAPVRKASDYPSIVK
jgi:hypothetical protein